MSEPMTLARPYARAAFSYADSVSGLDAWGAALADLAHASSDPKVAGLLNDPSKTAEQRAGAVCGLLGGEVPQGLANFLRVMADNSRLGLLADIAQQFDALKAAKEATIEVEVVSALEVADTEAERIAQAMSQRLERSVTISTKTDPSLIGGAVIRAGDLVIDGSVRGKLNKLAGALAP